MVKAVVGANWGDEGKGKITDMLAEKADIIVRFQGGDVYKRQAVDRTALLEVLISRGMYQQAMSIVST